VNTDTSPSSRWNYWNVEHVLETIQLANEQTLADERPCVAVEDPVSVTDLHATLFTAMGVSPKTVYEIENRPFYATEDGRGKPLEDVFAS
jgi:hypothetical protein